MEKHIKGYDQRPQGPNNWLTHLNDGESEKQRQFVKVIHLPEGQTWDEVTDEYYKEWSEKYRPEPTSEKETEASVAKATE